MRPKLFRKKPKTTKSQKLYLKAIKIIPGGVNSPVRAFKAVERNPLFIKKASGAYIWDEDKNKYIDYVGSWGPSILGHTNPSIIKQIRTTATSGISFGAPTKNEIRLAELITKLIPSVEMVRLVNSGTEATMSAIRLARAFTGKTKIIKFEGCYHGHADAFLVKAGSGATTLGIPDSAGIPATVATETLNAQYNNIDSVKKLFDQYHNEIAAVIVEPIAGNMGCVPPRNNFLQELRTLCNIHKALLIFDEVMTGFRVSPGGAQTLYGVQPDLTTLGKIIGGGLPVGAYGGKSNIMELVAPAGPMYQAGTLAGNPVVVAAGFETLRILSTNKMIYRQLEQRGAKLTNGISALLSAKGIPHFINRVGSMFTIFFTNSEVVDYTTAKTSDTEMFKKFFNAILDQGIYFPPSQFEAAFLSTAHTDKIIDKTLIAVETALRTI